MDNILSGVLAVIAFVVGGLISRWLDAWPVWANWHPFLFGQPAPFVKSVGAFFLVAVILLVLVTIYQLGPGWYSRLTPDEQAILVMWAAVLGAFIRNQTSAMAKLKAQVGEQGTK